MAGAPDERDPRALKILMETYWSSQGWKPSPATLPDDLAYATAAGFMCPPGQVSHDDLNERVLSLVEQVEPRKVSDAFLRSLTTRRLDWRSALGSYAVGRLLPRHANPGTSGNCQECGAYLEPQRDWNVLNFERHKWGGVRHLNPEYVALDLEQFLKLEVPEATDEDRDRMGGILDAAGSLPPKARARHLEKAIKDIFPSSKDERDRLLTILGYCGILESARQPGFSREYIPPARRDESDDTDWPIPINWWRGSDGVNMAAVALFLPTYAPEAQSCNDA